MISETVTISKSNSILEAQGLTRRFGGLIAVNNVSFTVEKNEIFGLIGPNGAGKTTLFNLMTGLIPASSGNLIYQNENISQLKPYQIANKGIARTFQNIRLFGELSAVENVAISSEELVEKVENSLNHFIEAVAVMIITSCVIPMLVLLLFFWMVKIVLDVDLSGVKIKGMLPEKKE